MGAITPIKMKERWVFPWVPRFLETPEADHPCSTRDLRRQRQRVECEFRGSRSRSGGAKDLDPKIGDPPSWYPKQPFLMDV